MQLEIPSLHFQGPEDLHWSCPPQPTGTSAQSLSDSPHAQVAGSCGQGTRPEAFLVLQTLHTLLGLCLGPPQRASESLLCPSKHTGMVRKGSECSHSGFWCAEWKGCPSRMVRGKGGTMRSRAGPEDLSPPPPFPDRVSGRARDTGWQWQESCQNQLEVGTDKPSNPYTWQGLRKEHGVPELLELGQVTLLLSLSPNLPLRSLRGPLTSAWKGGWDRQQGPQDPFPAWPRVPAVPGHSAFPPFPRRIFPGWGFWDALAPWAPAWRFQARPRVVPVPPPLPRRWRVAVARESPLRRGGPQPSQAGAAQEWDKTFLDPQPGARHRREGAPEVPGEAGPPRR